MANGTAAAPPESDLTAARVTTQPTAREGKEDAMSTAEEMEAGRKRSRYWANPGASSPQTKPDPSGEDSGALPIDTGIVTAATPKQPQVECINPKAGSPNEPMATHPAAPVSVANALAGDSAANPATPKHDKEMARRFLAGLDPNASRFTFQLFSDGAGDHRQIFHGSLDELWPKVRMLNTPQRGVGVFVTISETDFKGRSTNNIVRPRAIFADADGKEQAEHCRLVLEVCDAAPSMAVNSGRGYHFYFLTNVPRDQFSMLQVQLSAKLGTDAAVKDLPRVMRLPGTLHLKDPTKPKLVKLLNPPNCSVKRWQLSELVGKLGLSPANPSLNQGPSKTANLTRAKPDLSKFAHADREYLNKVFGLHAEDKLAAGFEANIEEVRSAVSAIPPSAIATEPEWMKLARALAHEAVVNKAQAEQLWEILNTASRRAPGYDEADNRTRWLRYIDEAWDHENPITIDTVFHMALDHGWQWSPPVTAAPNAVAPPVSPPRAIPIANLPLVPRKREWVHGNDLMRGAVSMLSAPGARAKTTWLLTCALACTSGRQLLGAHVFGGPLRVLYLSAEDSTDEIALHHGLNNADVPGLHVIGTDQWGLALLRSAAGGAPIIDPAGWSALIAELDQIKPDVLVIDPLINVMGGVDVNSNSAAALLIGQLAALAAKRRIAVMIAHHVAKGRDPASAEAAMGAASFVNLCRIALGIEPLPEDEAGQIGLPPWEAKSVFRIVGTKLNYSPPGTDDRWYRLLSVEIQNQQPPIYITGDRVAVVEQFHPGSSGPTFPPQLIRDALLALDAADPPLSPSKQSRDRYAGPTIAEAIAPHRRGQASGTDATAILDHIIRTGLVRVESVKVSRPGGRSDNRNGLVLTPTGKAIVRHENQVTTNSPQSPQTPAEPTAGNAGNAGGDPQSGPPHR
jgi:hypothetical protein